VHSTAKRVSLMETHTQALCDMPFPRGTDGRPPLCPGSLSRMEAAFAFVGPGSSLLSEKPFTRAPDSCVEIVLDQIRRTSAASASHTEP
jgi:hypothetical protein